MGCPVVATLTGFQRAGLEGVWKDYGSAEEAAFPERIEGCSDFGEPGCRPRHAKARQRLVRKS